MDDMFEEVLALCLDRLDDGDDVESCVADFPECPELRPLLEIAAALSATATATSRHAADEDCPAWLAFSGPRIGDSRRRLRPTG